MITNYLLVIILFFFIPSISHALDKIKPNVFINIGAEYNDNIFFEKEPQTEFITTIIPGINVKMIAQKWLEEIDYRVKFLDYRNIEQKNVQHHLKVNGWHELSNKLFFSIQGNLIEDKEETVEDDFSVTKQEYLKQNIATSIRFQIQPRLGTDIKYQYEDFEFRKENENDSKEQEVFFNIDYTLSERLNAIGVYQYKKRDYENNDTLNLELFGAGIHYELTPRDDSRLIIKYGKTAHNKTFVCESNINHRINEKTIFSFNLERTIKFSRSSVNSIEVDGVTINISRELSKKTNFNSSIKFMQGDWQNINRKDKLQTITSGLSHQINKETSFSINYNHLYGESNLGAERRNNIYTFSLQVQ